MKSYKNVVMNHGHRRWDDDDGLEGGRECKSHATSASTTTSISSTNNNSSTSSMSLTQEGGEVCAIREYGGRDAEGHVGGVAWRGDHIPQGRRRRKETVGEGKWQIKAKRNKTKHVAPLRTNLIVSLSSLFITLYIY